MAMKSVLVVALAMAIPAVAGTAAASPGAKPNKKFCTEVKPKSGSRVNQRVCMTADQWREKLGNDWQDRLAGNDADAELNELLVRGKLDDGPALKINKRGSPDS
jgi:basic membrane lipoprotein Med (substrate-binding protein (PBP1-ABC) superfamily)